MFADSEVLSPFIPDIHHYYEDAYPTFLDAIVLIDPMLIPAGPPKALTWLFKKVKKELFLVLLEGVPGIAIIHTIVMVVPDT